MTIENAITGFEEATPHEATYSAEDNKLRIYPAHRLSDEEYQAVKDAGFKWAPKQALFVAPRWTPAREDLCMEYAGAIEPEGTTLAERAAAKADRLGDLSLKRANDANAFSAAADQISQRFYMGQPILVGHHSERKARKDQQRMHAAMEQSVKAAGLSEYWAYRAAGVERHANDKNRSDVRARRIKTLLKDLRDKQRDLNHLNKCLQLWQEIKALKKPEDRQALTEQYTQAWFKSGPACYRDAGKDLSNATLTVEQVIDKNISVFSRQIEQPYYQRWIRHILNRLGYETAMLGAVPRYEGSLSAAIIQGFARTHGTEKPKARRAEEYWVLDSPVPFPAHLGALGGLGDDHSLRLTEEEWRDLMQQSGYEVPAKAPAKPPILNFPCQTLTYRNPYHREWITLEVVSLTKAEYNAIYKDRRGIQLSACGTFRFRRYVNYRNGRGEAKAVFLSDSKTHPRPESPYIDATPETLEAGV